jgi:hypothetical protein
VSEVRCERCADKVPLAESEVSASGYLCRKCALERSVEAHTGVSVKDTLAEGGRSLLAAGYRKHLYVGTLATAFGIFLVWTMIKLAVVSRGLVVGAWGTLAAGLADLGWALRGFAKLAAEKRAKR